MKIKNDAMTDNHPITPPPELVNQWLGAYFGCTFNSELSDSEHYITTQAAQWGADQELEACCDWLSARPNNLVTTAPELAEDLHAARRPKPPSLKAQALDALGREEADSCSHHNLAIIRRALEALPE
jgi:hypothetical protein